MRKCWKVFGITKKKKKKSGQILRNESAGTLKHPLIERDGNFNVSIKTGGSFQIQDLMMLFL